MPVQAITAVIRGTPNSVYVGKCVVQRNDWNELDAYIPPLKTFIAVNDGVVEVTEEQFNILKGEQ